VWAGGFGAARIQRQRMLFQRKAFGFGHRSLALFDFWVVKLFHATAIEADQVVMVRAFVQLIHGFAALEIAAREQARLFKLRQHAIDRSQTDVGVFTQQHPVHIFRRHVALRATLKNLHDLQARQRGFEARVFEFVQCAHDVRWGLRSSPAKQSEAATMV
jgi:uncharacterized membrane protein YcjF (UPF0283 family)